MSTLHRWYLGIMSVLVLGAGLAIHLYSVAQARAEAQQEATNKVVAIKDKELADLKTEMDARDAKFDRQIAELKTAKQATQVLAPIIVPQGGTAPPTVSKSDLPADIAKTLPGPPSANFTLFTDDQLVKLGKRELACQKAEGDISTCIKEKAALADENGKLKKANADWVKAGKVGPWIAGLGAARNADGKGYTPTMLFGRRFGSQLGVMGGVQGRGDLSLWLTWNFGGSK